MRINVIAIAQLSLPANSAALRVPTEARRLPPEPLLEMGSIYFWRYAKYHPTSDLSWFLVSDSAAGMSNAWRCAVTCPKGLDLYREKLPFRNEKA